METNHRKMVIMRGIPGSGKTTYSKQLVDQGYNRISKDDIREMLNNYKLNNSDEKLVHDIQMNILRTLILDGRNIVIDNTHIRDSYIKEIKDAVERMSKLVNYEYEIEMKLINTDLKVCIERNAKRSRPVFEKVIKKMHDDLVKNLKNQ